jgi:hypothetical protein
METKTPKPSTGYKEIDLRIENGIATWNCNLTGPIHGTYIGQFKFRCFLTPLQRIEADKLHRELLGPNPTLAEENVSFLSWALSQAKYRIISSPPFWKTESIAGNLVDDNVIAAVLDVAITAEARYKEDLKKRRDAVSEAANGVAEAALDAVKQPEENLDEA